MAADTHRPNATRPAVDWDKLEGPALSELTPRLYLLTRWRDYLRLLVDCTLRFLGSRAGHFFEGSHPESACGKIVKQLAFADHNPFAIGRHSPAETSGRWSNGWHEVQLTDD